MARRPSSRIRAAGSRFPGAPYAQAALAQVPRALTLLDRNPVSPTYGCFDRSWWLDRATDFPNALAQYAVHGLALAWALPLPGNPYHRKPALRRWVEAGLSFLVDQAHGDGSFDEFYPNERGWAGPSGFLLYAMLSAYELVEVDPRSGLGRRIRETALRCARMHLARTERGTLANHYAVAFLAVAKTRRVLGEESLEEPLRRRFEDLLALQNPEGWFLEYDGPDPGYLSATVSFLAKMEREGFRHPELRPAVGRALPFLAHFLWPDGTFGGALGSRQTVHLYPHGLEHFAPVFPLAAALARAAREGYARGGFVPPAVQSDHYYHYRVNELLEAARDARPLPWRLPPLPHQEAPFVRHFPDCGVVAVRTHRYYAVVNLRKGGVLRAYAVPSGKPAVLDSGVQVRLADGSAAAANWVNPTYETGNQAGEVFVRGRLCRIPFRVFDPPRFLLFRLAVLLLGVFPPLAERLKGYFRRMLALGVRSSPVRFERHIRFGEGEIAWEDRLDFGGAPVAGLWVGAETPLRYVPQSRHFQRAELEFPPIAPPPPLLQRAREEGGLRVSQSVRFPTLDRDVRFSTRGETALVPE